MVRSKQGPWSAPPVRVQTELPLSRASQIYAQHHCQPCDILRVSVLVDGKHCVACRGGEQSYVPSPQYI